MPSPPTTLAQILLFTNPLLRALAGVQDRERASPRLPASATPRPAASRPCASPCSPSRADLQAVTGLAKADIALAYTFRTQTISGTFSTTSHGGTASSPPGAIQIAGIPYTALLPGVCAALGQTVGDPSLDCTKPLPSPFAFNTYTATGAAGSNVTDVFAKYGVNPAVVPRSNIETVYEPARSPR